MKYILSKHAQDQARKRKIPVYLVEFVLNNPQQIIEERGSSVYQSLVKIGAKTQLLRVVTNDRINPVVVKTIYSTTQIKRYWRNEE